MDRPEIMDDVSDEFETKGERPPRRFRGDSGMDPQKKALIFGAAGAVVLIILLIALFGGGEKTSLKELEAIKSRLDGMEKRLAKIEGVDQRFSPLEAQIKGLQASVSKLEGQTRSIREHMEKLAQPAPPKPQVQATAPTKKPAANGGKHLHEVKRGETLFSIAKKYGMKRDELRRLNNLSKNDSIQLGQKLIVTSGN